MTAWWDVGPEAREAIARPDADKQNALAKWWFLFRSFAWGETAGILESCFVPAYYPSMWRRQDANFRENLQAVEDDLDRRTVGFIDRRMSEGDATAATARFRATRGLAKAVDRTPPYVVEPIDPALAGRIIKAQREARGVFDDYATTSDPYNVDNSSKYPPGMPMSEWHPNDRPKPRPTSTVDPYNVHGSRK